MDRRVFYDSVRHRVFGGFLSSEQVTGMENLLNVWEKYFAVDGNREELAYDLATASWETGMSMQPITERGPRNYFDKYEPGTKIGKVLGNTQPGDGYRYRGEGHVQNTGRRNAQKATDEINRQFGLGVDLVANPEQRGDPLVSAISLFLGNRQGWWTGKDIGDYIDGIDEADDEDLREFINSRRVVNGTDKAETIARRALAFEDALQAAGYQTPKDTPEPLPQPEITPEPEPQAPVKQTWWQWIWSFFS